MPRAEPESLEGRPEGGPVTDRSPLGHEKPGSRRSARTVLVGVATHPATWAVVPLAVIAVVVAARAGTFVPRFDYAIQELAVQEASHGERLLGPYSRFGFNHPGPLLAYANVPAYLLLGRNGGLSMILTRFAVDAACIVLVLVLVDRIGRRTAAWGAAAGIVWFELRVGLEWFRDPWNPYAVVLPIVLAVVAGAALVDAPPGRRWRGVVLVVAGSFAVQSHIGAAPLVALALLLGGVGFVRSARRPGTRRPAAVDAGIVVAAGLACWAPPIWEQLAERGNLRAVARFSMSGGATPSLDTVADPVALATTLGAGHLGNVFGPQPLEDVPGAGVLTWAVLVAVLLVAVAYAVWSWRRGRTGMAALAACVPAAVAVELVATLRIKGAVEPYLFAAALAVGAITWLVVGAAIGDGLERVVSTRQARAVLAGAVAVLGIVALAVSGRAFDPPTDSYGSPRAAALARGIDEVCAADRPVTIVSTTAPWFSVVEVGAAIDRCASDVRFEPGLETLVGPDRVDPTPGDDSLTVRIETPGGPLEPGWRRVARAAGTTLDVHDADRGG